MIFEDDNLKIDYFHTEYDDFLINNGKISIKINKLDKKNDNFVSSFLFFAETAQIGFASLEVKPDDLAKKKLLNEISFYYCNTTASLFNKNIGSIEYPQNLPDIYKDKSNESLKKIIDITDKRFGWGRIYEDLNLYDKGHERMVLILKNILKREESNILLSKDNENIIGFYIFENRKNYTEAIFAGIDHSIKSQFDGYLNLQAFHKYLFTTEKINYIKTSITLSNLGVLNIYNKLNYSFYNVKEDYHFFYEK
jgi:hypothetical protein